MVNLVQISGPAIEPLTVADLKAHLRLDFAQGEIAPTAPTAALISPAAAGNVDNGAHRYLVTFVTADGETDAGAASSVVTVADKAVNGKVSLTAIPTGGANVTARKVYRTIAAGATYLLLTTLADNTTTVYTDNTADSGLGAAAPSVNTTEDAYLTTLIQVARLTCENTIKGKLITQTWRQYFDFFPASAEILLHCPPLQSVSSIQYKDENGATQTLSADLYTASTSGERGRVVLKQGENWPMTLAQAPDTVWIEMVCGYGASRGSIPAPLRQGMLTLIAHLYNMREDVISGTIVAKVPKTSEYLWSAYKAWEF